MNSKRFTLNGNDFRNWFKNAIIFAAPDLVVFLGAMSARFSAEGALVAVLFLNLVIDILRKYISGK